MCSGLQPSPEPTRRQRPCLQNGGEYRSPCPLNRRPAGRIRYRCAVWVPGSARWGRGAKLFCRGCAPQRHLRLEPCGSDRLSQRGSNDLAFSSRDVRSKGNLVRSLFALFLRRQLRKATGDVEARGTVPLCARVSHSKLLYRHNIASCGQEAL